MMETPQQKIARTQSSHILLVFSKAASGKEREFRQWVKGQDFSQLHASDQVLSVLPYAVYPLPISETYRSLGYDFLSVCRLCLDGAKDAAGLADQIRALFTQQEACSDTAMGLYYPVGETVGAVGKESPSYVAMAFSNPKPGRENEFREWYVTQHVRHALMVPGLINGQVFEASQFQMHDFPAFEYTLLALYEMGTSPEALLASIPQLDTGKMAWSPAGDTERFTEWFFERL